MRESERIFRPGQPSCRAGGFFISGVSRSPTSSAPLPTLQSAFFRVGGGVVRIQTATCSAGAQGSGFVIGDRLVATAAHVVQNGQTIRVINGTMSAAGTVIGVDPTADVALVRTAATVPGGRLELSRTEPRVGDSVAALGYTVGEPLSFKPGSINSVDRKATIDGITRYGLLELDFAANHGNSGGPVIDSSGAVVGLVDAQADITNPDGDKTGERQGDRLAVSAATAAPLLQRWEATPDRPDVAKCAKPVGPDDQAHPVAAADRDAASQAFQTLNIYFDSIENGDYPTGVAQLARPMSVTDFRNGVKSTANRSFAVKDVTVDPSGAPRVWLGFVSEQQKGDGPSGSPEETCTIWSLDYRFERVNGLWLIRGAFQHGNAPLHKACGADAP